ncbi:hypothetical protein MTO96_009108 [Rhipicephalus appendiculatus]
MRFTTSHRSRHGPPPWPPTMSMVVTMFVTMAVSALDDNDFAVSSVSSAMAIAMAMAVVAKVAASGMNFFDVVNCLYQIRRTLNGVGLVVVAMTMTVPITSVAGLVHKNSMTSVTIAAITGC